MKKNQTINLPRAQAGQTREAVWVVLDFFAEFILSEAKDLASNAKHSPRLKNNNYRLGNQKVENKTKDVIGNDCKQSPYQYRTIHILKTSFSKKPKAPV